MIRCILVVMFASLTCDSAGRAQEPKPDSPEPPVLLKKKDRPAPAPSTTAEPRQPPVKKSTSQEDLQRDDLEETAAAKLERVLENMRASEQRLMKRDPGPETLQVQRDAIKAMDELIEAAKRQQQNNNRSQSSSSERRDSRKNQGKANQKHPEQRIDSKNDKTDAARRSENRPAIARPTSKEGLSKIADLYKDVWGHLPETLRQEMDQYSREQFMPKYGDLLKQYYATIAEKGHKKGD